MTEFQATPRRTLVAVLACAALTAAVGQDAAPPVKRQQFVYVLRVAPDYQDAGRWAATENAVVARHFERLAKAAQSGQVILAGRTVEGLAQTFGLVIFEADDAESARQFMASDPAVAAGLMHATLHPYAVALQRKVRVE